MRSSMQREDLERLSRDELHILYKEKMKNILSHFLSSTFKYIDANENLSSLPEWIEHYVENNCIKDPEPHWKYD